MRLALVTVLLLTSTGLMAKEGFINFKCNGDVCKVDSASEPIQKQQVYNKSCIIRTTSKSQFKQCSVYKDSVQTAVARSNRVAVIGGVRMTKEEVQSNSSYYSSSYQNNNTEQTSYSLLYGVSYDRLVTDTVFVGAEVFFNLNAGLLRVGLDF